ncbi:DUF6406 domain-containing protein [Streptomyces chrestomyceticus]|uniref:DUF6406 domain-containing protein n=1 Tax=Streptomyces chrestomyceticus TaxID=68185 RepID=A0ABU7WY84_9ACTN
MHLWHGIQRNAEIGSFSVGDIYRDSDALIRVKIVIVAPEERHYTLRIGETFPVRDETWKLAELTGWPSEDDWTVVLRRITDAPA